MARLDNGFLEGFSGRLGSAVGFKRFGHWYLRARARQVTNPRTEAQQEHRAMFKQEVQLAAQMRWAVNVGMKEVAHQMGLTAQNLFVKANQQAFSMVSTPQPSSDRGAGRAFRVNYTTLQVSLGPVAPVAITNVERGMMGDELTVHFDKNPEHRAADAYDSVYLWVYSSAAGKGYLTNPVYRRAKRIDVLLPEWMSDDELHLYAFVQDKGGRCSETAYGCLDQGVGDEENGAGDEDEVIGGGGGASGGDGLLDIVEGKAFNAHLTGSGSEVGHG